MELFTEYQDVWNILKQNNTKEGEVENLDRTTTLDKFLSKSNTLIELVRIHNDLIDQLKDNCNLGPDVNLFDVKPTHLVMYDREKDLLPLVTANCSSSLELGQGTFVECNFENMEYQLMESLLDGRSRIEYNDTMVFSDNLTTVHKLEHLRKKIEQEPFTPDVEIELRDDTRFAKDVNDPIDNLDIAISFLHTGGSDPDRYLRDFMKEDLGKDPPPLPRATKEHCQFKHIRALWLLMCNEREKHAVTVGAIPFCALTEERYDIYREPLEPEQLKQLNFKLKETKRLDKLLRTLFTCIALTILKKDVSPSDLLTECLSEGNATDVEATEATEAAESLKLPDIVIPISVSQCMFTWRAVYDYSSKLNKE